MPGAIYTDQPLRRREQQLISLSVGLVGTGTILAMLVLLHRSRALQATVTTVVVGVVVALAITHRLRWKISLHLGGIAGAVTVFVLLWGWPALLLTPLVGCAPIRGPGSSGSSVAVAITVGVFWLFGVL